MRTFATSCVSKPPTRAISARRRLAPLCVALAALHTSAFAQLASSPVLSQAMAPAHLVSLQAAASREVDMDWLTLTLSTWREGDDAAAVQAQVRVAVDAALDEARRAAKPGLIEVRTGNFSLQPRYQTVAGKSTINGWRGQAEVILEGRDLAGIAALAGRMRSLSVARVQPSLSREARQKTEGALTGEAIEAFKTKADLVAKQFGYPAWALHDVNVSGDGPAPAASMMTLRGTPAMAEALPLEAGKATVTVSVGGQVRLQR